MDTITFPLGDVMVMTPDIELLFKTAQEKGWKDVGTFGHGKMITEITNIGEWRLFPADLYNNPIPAWAMQRVFYCVNAGIKIKGIVIADDLRKYTEKPTKPVPPKLPDMSEFVKFIGALFGFLLHAALMIGYIALMIIASIIQFDPLVVIVLDGKEDSPWMYIAEYYA